MPSNRLKILCLHGFTSNGAVHAHQVRKITGALPEFEFVFPDGPHQVDMSSRFDPNRPQDQLWTQLVNSYSSSGHRAWWYAEESNDRSQGGYFKGLEKSLEYIGELTQRQGPFHAIWGFSQGACFAGILCALLQETLADHPLRKYIPSATITPQAGIIFSGFKARFDRYQSIYAQGLSLPTIHILGLEDDDVTPDRSEEFIQICRDPTVIKHVGGHNIPKSIEDHVKVIKFVKQHVVGSSPRQTQSSI